MVSKLSGYHKTSSNHGLEPCLNAQFYIWVQHEMSDEISGNDK